MYHMPKNHVFLFNFPIKFYDVFSLLQKCLDTLDLTSLGVGSCVGTGMYLVAGMVARNVAGPGVIISFIIAAVASIFSGKIYKYVEIISLREQS